MKKIIFALPAVIFAVIFFTQCQQNQNNAIVTQDGARLFDHYCAGCHQGNGIGGPTPGGGLNAPDIRQFTKSKSELEGIISNGFGKMPAFADSTTKENISLIAAYVATQIEIHSSVNNTSSKGSNQ